MKIIRSRKRIAAELRARAIAEETGRGPDAALATYSDMYFHGETHFFDDNELVIALALAADVVEAGDYPVQTEYIWDGELLTA